jgi:hypothetical protein
MAVTAYINSSKVIIQRGSVTVDKRLEERSTANFTVADTLGTAVYDRGMPVEIYDSTPTLIFAGFIDTPSRVRIAPNSGLLHNITCMDNHYLADKRLVVRSYTNQTAGYIANAIVTDYLADEGITVGEIQTGPIVKSAVFNYVRASEAFDALKELTGFTWFINEAKQLYFVDRATYTAPWDLDGSTHKAIRGSVKLNTGNPMYRNRQWVRGGKGLTSQQTETKIGDGETQSFALGYPLALEPTITVGGTPKTVGIKGIDTGKDWYWNKGDNSIYAAVAPAASAEIVVLYYGQYPLIVLAADDSARVARQSVEGGSGIVEEIITEAQHESLDAMKESAKAKLNQYCQDAEKFSYQTNEAGLSPGQIQKVTYSPFGFSAYEMLIESVSITANGELILYDVSAITGPVMGSWTRFFNSILTRQDKTIQVGDSLLLVLFQQAEELVLVEATDSHSDSFVSEIVNRWIALPPSQAKGHDVEHERLNLTEAPASVSHATSDYHWGDSSQKWDFWTW